MTNANIVVVFFDSHSILIPVCVCCIFIYEYKVINSEFCRGYISLKIVNMSNQAWNSNDFTNLLNYLNCIIDDTNKQIPPDRTRLGTRSTWVPLVACWQYHINNHFIYGNEVLPVSISFVSSTNSCGIQKAIILPEVFQIPITFLVWKL